MFFLLYNYHGNKCGVIVFLVSRPCCNSVNRFFQKMAVGYLVRFQTLDDISKVALLRQTAELSPKSLCSDIVRLKITDPEKLGPIAVIAAKVRFSIVQENIEIFNFPKDSPYFFQLAEVGLRNNPWNVEIPFREHFTVEQQTELLLLRADLLLEQFGKGTEGSHSFGEILPTSLLQYYPCLGEKQYYELFEKVVRQAEGDLLSQISFHQYPLTQAMRAQLTEMIIDRNPYIEDLQIEVFLFGEKGRFGVDPSHQTMWYPTLQRYLARAEQARFIHANEECKKNSCFVEKNLASYRLNPEHRFEIAKLRLESMGSEDDFHVSSYLLEEKDLFSLGKLYVVKNPFITDKITQFVPKATQEYDVLSALAEKGRFLCAEKDLLKSPQRAHFISLLEQRYLFSKREYCFALAKKAILQDPEYMQDLAAFRVHPQDRLSLAREIGQTHGLELSKYIQFFQLEDELDLLLICAISLNSNKKSSAYIGNYGFLNEKYLNKLQAWTQAEKPEATSRSQGMDLSHLMDAELLSKEKKLMKKLFALEALHDNKAVSIGEKANTKELIKNLRYELSLFEQEIKKRRLR